ncbi:hypothetical protein ACFPRL_06130 [Pseudoclavibacter helvolus]
MPSRKWGTTKAVGGLGRSSKSRRTSRCASTRSRSKVCQEVAARRCWSSAT